MMVLEKMAGKPLRTSSYQRGLFNTQVKMNIVLNGNMNESSGKAGKRFYSNTELGIDLKLMTKEPGRMAVGEYLDGAITHDGEDHFTFVQNDQEKKLQKVVQRNPHVYEGKYINVNRKKTVRSTLPSTARSSQSTSPSRTSARVPPTSCASLAARVMTVSNLSLS